MKTHFDFDEIIKSSIGNEENVKKRPWKAYAISNKDNFIQPLPVLNVCIIYI